MDAFYHEQENGLNSCTAGTLWFSIGNVERMWERFNFVAKFSTHFTSARQHRKGRSIEKIMTNQLVYWFHRMRICSELSLWSNLLESEIHNFCLFSLFLDRLNSLNRAKLRILQHYLRDGAKILWKDSG